MNHRFRKWSILSGVIGVPVFSLVAGSQLLEGRGSALRARDSLTAAHRAVEAADVGGPSLISTPPDVTLLHGRPCRRLAVALAPSRPSGGQSRQGVDGRFGSRSGSRSGWTDHRRGRGGPAPDRSTSSLTGDLDRMHAGAAPRESHCSVPNTISPPPAGRSKGRQGPSSPRSHVRRRLSSPPWRRPAWTLPAPSGALC